jgi:predicted DNA-binding transcriptional regulator YafY
MGVQQQAEFVSQRIVIDPRGWRDSSDALTGLPAILKALWSERQLSFHYASTLHEPGERVVHPLGLVARGAVWYLIASRDEQIRTYRVSRMRDVAVREEPGMRPTDFDLATYWEQSTTKFRAQLPQYHATYRVAPSVMKWERYRGWRLLEQAPDGDRIRIRLRFDIEEEALQFALSFGSDVELVEPRKLRDKVLQAAEGMVRVYLRGPKGTI